MNEDESDTNCVHKSTAIIFVAFYLSVIALAAIISPILFATTRYLANTYSISLLQHYVDKGFGKFFDRSRWVALAILLPVFLNIIKLKLSRDIGLNRLSTSKFIKIFFLGCIITSIIYYSLSYIYLFKSKEVILSQHIVASLKMLICALIIGIIEEIIFRGIILNAFARTFSLTVAILLSSIFFAYCHIGAGSCPQINTTFEYFDGIKCALWSLYGFTKNMSFMQLANLITLGMTLSLLTLRYKSILAAISFHTSTVFIIMQVRKFGTFLQYTHSGNISINILDTKITLFMQLVIIVMLLIDNKKVYE